MPETVICAPVRTAVGRYGGAFKDMQAAALGAILKALGRDDGEIDRLILEGVVSEQASAEG